MSVKPLLAIVLAVLTLVIGYRIGAGRPREVVCVGVSDLQVAQAKLAMCEQQKADAEANPHTGFTIRTYTNDGSVLIEAGRDRRRILCLPILGRVECEAQP